MNDRRHWWNEPNRASRMTVSGDRTPPNRIEWDVFSLRAPASLDLGGGCTGYVDFNTMVIARTTATSGAGYKLSLPIPNQTALIGLGVLFQSWFAPSTGPLKFETTNALELTVGR